MLQIKIENLKWRYNQRCNFLLRQFFLYVLSIMAKPSIHLLSTLSKFTEVLINFPYLTERRLLWKEMWIPENHGNPHGQTFHDFDPTHLITYFIRFWSHSVYIIPYYVRLNFYNTNSIIQSVCWIINIKQKCLSLQFVVIFSIGHTLYSYNAISK